MPGPHCWTKAETRRLVELRISGLSYSELATRFVGRSPDACRWRLQWILGDGVKRALGYITPDDPRLAAYLKSNEQGSDHYDWAYSPPIKVPPEIAADAARRETLRPRDLTAAIHGDPLPGYSALERPAPQKMKISLGGHFSWN